MSAICLRCRQTYSEEDHQCLEVLTLEQIGACREASEREPTKEDVEGVLRAVLEHQQIEWDHEVLSQHQRFTRRGMPVPTALADQAIEAADRVQDRARARE